MSKGQIQRYDCHTKDGQTRFFCSILRCYINVNKHEQPKGFYPPIDNGRNQKLSLAGKGER